MKNGYLIAKLDIPIHLLTQSCSNLTVSFWPDKGTIEETVDRRHVSASRVAFSCKQCIVLQTSHGTNSVTGNSIRMKNGCLMANPDMP
jgi:hypothetical protein